MTELEKEIFRLIKELDEVQSKAAMATAVAFVSGSGTVQALTAGNIILVANGYEPVHLNDLSGSSTEVEM